MRTEAEAGEARYLQLDDTDDNVYPKYPAVNLKVIH